MAVENASGFGELDALGAARHQLPIQLGFQAREMMADCGLRYVQLIRGGTGCRSVTIPTK